VAQKRPGGAFGLLPAPTDQKSEGVGSADGWGVGMDFTYFPSLEISPAWYGTLTPPSWWWQKPVKSKLTTSFPKRHQFIRQSAAAPAQPV